jgi:hypothetical protein
LSALLATGQLAAQDIMIPLPPYQPPAPIQPTPRSAPVQPVSAQSMPMPTARSAPIQPTAVHNVSFTPAKAVAAPAALTLSQFPKAGPPKTATSESEVDFAIRTDLPGPDLLFRRESEDQVFERIRQEGTRPGGPRIIFPERFITKQEFQPRQFPEIVSEVEPGHVAHRRLFFEQKNFDRYLWEIGYLQPAVSSGRFLYDIILMPYHCGTEPLRRWDASAGKCLPGDPTPLLCYGERFSVTGLTFQTFAVAGGILIFP